MKKFTDEEKATIAKMRAKALHVWKVDHRDIRSLSEEFFINTSLSLAQLKKRPTAVTDLCHTELHRIFKSYAYSALAI